MIAKDEQYKENLRIVGNNIREIRKSKDITQKDLADKMNSTKGSVSHFEKGIRELGLGVLIELSKQLNTPVEEILKGVK